MTDTSIRFIPEMFCQRAIIAPKNYSLFEEREFSLYLKASVFDKLSETGTFDLEKLDLAAFEMKHVLPVNMRSAVKNVYAGWAEGFNAKIRKAPATSNRTHTFF